ncbi:ABC transporter substrate-binding protein [Corynebacterium glyciniphilum]|uniref:Putative secreted protein n=1 Tax=Corynebacterium glyciniphilum AJ 3170 TaxID=1404245 RepID=X5DMD3_9CORY|nr:ABC transporter substrate-binding protein [Corynebacterium glyciniphilum]AHW64268.1 Putative secreted protein [Corynebacterium glyciniphilum AJ 3170]
MLPKRITSLIFAVGLACPLLVACGSDTPDTTGENGELRTVNTLRGEIDVPVDPQNVVAVDWQLPPVLVDLGITPVGIYGGYYEEDAAAARAVPHRYVEELADATRIGNWDAVDVEKISTLEPDLIVTTGVGLDDAQIDKLADIAPLAHFSSDDDMESQRQLADIVNRSEEFSDLRDDFDGKAAEIAERHRRVLADSRWVSVSGSQENTWFAEGGQTATGSLLNAVGAGFSDVVDPEGWWGDPLSMENLENLGDATVILYPADSIGDAAENTRPLLDNSRFRSLPAVTKGNLFGFTQGGASNIGWAIDALDEIDDILSRVNT